MTSSFNFSNFSRQSPKGILVIYIGQLYTLIKLTWVLLFFAIKDFSKISKIGGVYFFVAIALILVFFLVRAFLLYKNFQFKIEDNHFILQQGILKKTNTSLPFERIQNINFKQNLIQQIIDVHEVSVETAGSSKTEIAIKALDLEQAKALKDLVLKKSKTVEQSIEKIEDKPLLKISVLELFKVSLTENHLRNLFLFFAILIGFFQQIQQIAESFGETETLDGFIEESSNAVTPSFLIVFVMLMLLTVTAFLTSFVRIFLIHFNLTTYLKKDAFEINQGLFTKKSIVLKKKKVQNIIVSTNPLKRLIGISYITFKQAVSGEINNKNKEKLIRIVGCKKEQVQVIKENLFAVDEIENSKTKYPDNYYKRRVYIFTFLFLLSVYIGSFFLLPFINLLISLLIVIPVTFLLVHKKIKKRFYKISDDFLMVGKGLLETHHTYLELFKVQNIKMKQTYFQERSNVADVVLQTASGKITLPCLAVAEASKIYNYILYKVETSTKEWM